MNCIVAVIIIYQQVTIVSTSVPCLRTQHPCTVTGVPLLASPSRPSGTTIPRGSMELMVPNPSMLHRRMEFNMKFEFVG
jgi:hypothetical protein